MKVSKSQSFKIISIFFLTIVISIGAFVYFLIPSNFQKVEASSITSNVSEVGGKQIIEITSGGGFTPNTTVARSGENTVLKFKGNGMVDCSNTLSIPKLNIKNETLPLSSVKEFSINPQTSNTIADGSCSMGMYNFKIVFI